MASNVRLSDQTRNAMNDARAGVAESGKIEIRSGTQPATVGGSATGTLLAELSLDSTPFGASSAGSAALSDTPVQVDATASGTAGYYRILDSEGNISEDGTCGTSDADMILSTTSLVAGVQFSITSGTLAVPASAS